MKTTKITFISLKRTLMMIGALTALIISNNCASPSPAPTCTTTNTDFQQLYTAAVALPNHVDVTTYDTEIHEYTFTLSQNKTICSVGYQSLPATATLPYKIEIKDNVANTIIYTGNHVFSSTSTSYVSITPTNVIANNSYTIRRTLLASAAGGISNVIGRLVRQNGALVTFPKTAGIMTITGAKFFQNGGPLVDAGIPFIDIAYY